MLVSQYTIGSTQVHSEELNNLFQQGNADYVLQDAFRRQQEERQQQTQRRGTRRQPSGKRERVDWSSPERAGEPHRGIVSEAEKEYVRNNLDEVNERRRRKGFEEIDPNDPEMQIRYGLAPDLTGSAADGAEAEPNAKEGNL